jgi:hypothetical protein
VRYIFIILLLSSCSSSHEKVESSIQTSSEFVNELNASILPAESMSDIDFNRNIPLNAYLSLSVSMINNLLKDGNIDSLNAGEAMIILSSSFNKTWNNHQENFASSTINLNGGLKQYYSEIMDSLNSDFHTSIMLLNIHCIEHEINNNSPKVEDTNIDLAYIDSCYKENRDIYTDTQRKLINLRLGKLKASLLEDQILEISNDFDEATKKAINSVNDALIQTESFIKELLK